MSAPPLRLQGVGLTRSFRQGPAEIRAVADVDVELAAGELLAVMGPSGSGKSTLLHLLGGVDRPDAGRVLLDGRDITRLRRRELSAVRRREIGFLPQFFSLLPTLTALENVAFPLLLDAAPHAMRRAREALASVGLARREAHRPTELSGGEQQRVALARAFVTAPAAVLADEPTGSIDSQAGEVVLDLLRELTSTGTGVVLMSHDPRAARYADRTIHLSDGRVCEAPVTLASAS